MADAKMRPGIEEETLSLSFAQATSSAVRRLQSLARCRLFVRQFDKRSDVCLWTLLNCTLPVSSFSVALIEHHDQSH